jgi:hypothetical protein
LILATVLTAATTMVNAAAAAADKHFHLRASKPQAQAED